MTDDVYGNCQIERRLNDVITNSLNSILEQQKNYDSVSNDRRKLIDGSLKSSITQINSKIQRTNTKLK